MRIDSNVSLNLVHFLVLPVLSFVTFVVCVSVEDFNLNAVESLQGVPYVAVGKHLCGPATG